MRATKYWLGQLRHAYKNAIEKSIGDQVAFGTYLLSPAIVDAEKYVTAVEAELEELRDFKKRHLNSLCRCADCIKGA